MADTKIIKKLEMSITPDTKLLKVSVYVNNSILDETIEEGMKGLSQAHISVYNQENPDKPLLEITTDEETELVNNDIKITKEFTEEELKCEVLNNMFFVKIKIVLTQGEEHSVKVEEDIKGTVLYPTNLYKKMINVLREEHKKRCELPKNFIDAYLRYKGLQLSLLTGNQEDAIKYFKYLMR